jgi:hypothetical protein
LSGADRNIAGACVKPGILVNIESAFIFKGLFETHKSTRNGQKYAKMRAKSARKSGVYHACVKHDKGLRESNGLLRDAWVWSEPHARAEVLDGPMLLKVVFQLVRLLERAKGHG